MTSYFQMFYLLHGRRYAGLGYTQDQHLSEVYTH